MTREILFRGLRTDGGGWAEGNLIQFRHFDGVKFVDIVVISLQNTGTEIDKVIPETVGQFVRTINGQRLFDGDMFIQINHPETVHKIKIIDGEPTVWQKVVIQGVHDWMRDRVGLSVFAKAWQDTFQIIGTIHDDMEATP